MKEELYLKYLRATKMPCGNSFITFSLRFIPISLGALTTGVMPKRLCKTHCLPLSRVFVIFRFDPHFLHLSAALLIIRLLTFIASERSSKSYFHVLRGLSHFFLRFLGQKRLLMKKCSDKRYIRRLMHWRQSIVKY